MSDFDLQPAAKPPEFDLKPAGAAPQGVWLGDSVDRKAWHGILAAARDPATPLPESESIGKTPMPTIEQFSARITALKAQQEDPAKAREALALAPQANLTPAVVTGDLPGVKLAVEHTALSTQLQRAPVVAAAMSESNTHAAAIKEDVPQLSWGERYITGQAAPAKQIFDSSGAFSNVAEQTAKVMRDLQYEGAPSIWMSTIARVGLNIAASFKQITVDANEAAAQGLPELEGAAKVEQATRAQAAKDDLAYFDELASAPPTPAESTTGGKVASKVIGAAVGVAPLVLLSPLGVGGAFAYFAAQGYGDLRRQGVSPEHAAMGSTVAATAATVMGAGFLKSLAPMESVAQVQKTLVDQMTKLAVEPTFLQGMKDFGWHAASGWLMNMVMSMADKITVRLDHGIWDWSEVHNDLQESAVDSLALMPVIMATSASEHYAQKGRWAEAQANYVDHETKAIMVKDSKLADQNPDQLKEIIKNVYNQKRVVEQLQMAHDTAVANGVDPAPWKASLEKEQGKLSQHLDVDTFDAAAKKAGQDPAELAGRVMGDDGSAYREAKQSGTKLAIPLETYLTDKDLRGMHDDLKEGASSTPEGSTRVEVAQETPIPGPSKTQLEQLSALLAEREQIKSGAEGPERSAALQANEIKMRDLATSMPVNPQGGPGSGEGLEGGPRAASGATASAAAPPVEAEPRPKEGTTFARRPLQAYAELETGTKTIGELEATKVKYKSAATKAQNKADRMSGKAINLLSSAEETAQQGIDEATEAAKSGQAAAVSTEVARTAANSLKAEIRKILSGEMLKDIDPTNISDDVNKFVNRNVRRAVSAAANAHVTPEVIKSVVKAEVANARKQFTKSERGQRAGEDASVAATAKTVTAGEAVQEMQKQNKIRDMAKAMEAARVKALARADVLRGQLKDASTDAVRKRMYGAGLDGAYGQAYDMIMEGSGHRKQSGSPRPGSFQEVADTLTTEGGKLGFDIDHINEVVKKGIAPEDMRPDELENLARAVKNLQFRARETSKQYVRGKQMDRSDVVAEVYDALSKGAKPGKYVVGERKGSASAQRAADRATPDTLLGKLGGIGKDMLTRFFGARHSEGVMLGEIAKVFEGIPDELSKLGKTGVAYPPGMKLDASTLPEITRHDKWMIRLATSNEEGMKMYSDSWGMSPGEIESWLHDGPEGLTKDEYDKAIKPIGDRMAELGDREMAVDSNRGGVPMVRKTLRKITTPWGDEHTGWYAPDSWLDRPSGPKEVATADPTRGLNAMQDTQHNYTLTKTKYNGVPDPAFANLSAHLNAIAHDIAFSDMVRDNARLFNDSSFERTVKDFLGTDHFNQLLDWHNTVAKGRVVDEVRATWYTNAIINPARGLAAQAVFSGNLPVITGQGAHIPIVMSRAGINPVDMATGMARAVTAEGTVLANENSKVVPYRGERAREKYNQMVGDVVGRRFPVLEAINKPSQMLYHEMDGFLTRSLWHALVEKYSGGESPQMSPAEAYREADLVVNRSMPPIDVLSQSAMVRDQTLGIYMLVRNFPNVIYNMTAMDDWETRTRISGGANPYLAWGALAARRLGMVGGLALGKYVMGHGRNSEEQKEGGVGLAKFAFRSMITEIAYGHPLLHELADSYGSALHMTGFDPRTTRFNPRNIHLFDIPVHEQVQKVVEDLGKVSRGVMGNGEVTPAVVGALDAAGRVFGYSSLVRSGEGVYKAITDRDFKYHRPSSLLGKAGVSIYGDSPDSNLFSDIDEAGR